MSGTRGLRIALVVPRYHPEVSGGAELHGRWLAQRLAQRGHRVEALSTCALDAVSWANELEPGVSADGEVTVRRFPVDERDAGERGRLERQLRAGLDIGLEDEERWLREGVCSRALEDHLRRQGGDYDVVIALPYLVGTTYFAREACPDRFALIPCLHDEVFARCEFSRKLLRESWGIFFNTEPERRLAQSIESWPARSEIVGLGFDPPASVDPEAVRQKYGLPDGFLVCISRLEQDKNMPMLFEYQRRFAARHADAPPLVVVGQGDVEPPPDVLRPALDWADRDSLIAAAAALIQPSVKESLSIVMFQAWAVGTPTLVHAGGAVPRYLSERAGAGLWFAGYPEYEACLERLLSDDGLRLGLGAAGRRFCEAEYSWEQVLDRLEAAVAEWRTADAAIADVV